MIRVCFAAGCYGHFLGQCLYYFTNLRVGPFRDLHFDETGSSHDFNQNKDARTKIRLGHRSHMATRFFSDTLEAQPGDSIVTIATDPAHWLDYCNNQFSKKYRGDFAAYLDDLLSHAEVRQKLSAGWHCDTDIQHAPRWMQRELFSYMMLDLLRDGYATDLCGFADAVIVSTKDLFEDFPPVFRDLVTQLGLRLAVSQQDIDRNHQRFIQAQRFHGSQQRCEQWARQVVSDDSDAVIPALTLFDEAYIQHCLRQLGWEIRCHGLDRFPGSACAMREVIYPA